MTVNIGEEYRPHPLLDVRWFTKAPLWKLAVVDAGASMRDQYAETRHNRRFNSLMYLVKSRTVAKTTTNFTTKSRRLLQADHQNND